MDSTRFRIVVVIAVLGASLLAPAVHARPDSADEMFERAEKLYRQLRQVDPDCADPAAWSSLVSAFGRIPADHPGSPLAGDALWRVGDIQTRLALAGRAEAIEPAIEAYETLADGYPDSAYAPEAYLRLAQLSSGAAARAYYSRLVQDYPSTPQATLAAEYLSGERDIDNGRLVPSTDAVAASEAATHESPQPLGEELEAQPTPASDTSPERRTSEAPAPSAFADIAHVLKVRHYSDAKHTRVVFDLDRSVQHRLGELSSPPRVYIDLIGTDLPAALPRSIEVDGTGVKQIRMAVNRPGVVRAVLDLETTDGYSVFSLANPYRLVLDVPSPEMAERLATARRPDPTEGGSEARQLGLGIRRIVVDPGHGGVAPGAIGRSGITEKELTMDISRRLADNLRASGYEVLLTRNDDESVPLENRPSFATQQKADLFVSVHVNASDNRNLAGFETYYLDMATDPTALETAFRENAMATIGVGELEEALDEIVKNANKRESRDLAQSIQDSLVLQSSKRYDGVRDLGVKHAPFVVLVGADMPAVLVECSFISHPDEEARLRDPDYRQGLADAIHIGIENYASRRRMVSAAR